MRPAPPPTTVADARGAISRSGHRSSRVASDRLRKSGPGTTMVLAAIAVTGALLVGWLVLRLRTSRRRERDGAGKRSIWRWPVAIAVPPSLAFSAAPSNAVATSSSDAPASAAVPPPDASAPRADAKAAVRGVAIPSKLVPFAVPRAVKSAEPDDWPRSPLRSEQAMTRANDTDPARKPRLGPADTAPDPVDVQDERSAENAPSRVRPRNARPSGATAGARRLVGRPQFCPALRGDPLCGEHDTRAAHEAESVVVRRELGRILAEAGDDLRRSTKGSSPRATRRRTS